MGGFSQDSRDRRVRYSAQWVHQILLSRINPDHWTQHLWPMEHCLHTIILYCIQAVRGASLSLHQWSTFNKYSLSSLCWGLRGKYSKITICEYCQMFEYSLCCKIHIRFYMLYFALFHIFGTLHTALHTALYTNSLHCTALYTG
jgi:hypothetical protein